MKNCMIIGAQKAGTTTLFDALGLHPKIGTGQEKEINFFSYKYDRGIDWYKSQFPPGASVALDASPQYMHEELTASRLERDLPESYLICILRDPLDRAISNYRFNLSRGQQNPGRSFLEEVKSERGCRTYLRKGLYCEQLSRFDHFFEAGRFLILNFDELARNQQSVVNDALKLLDLEPMLERIHAKDLRSNETRQVSGTSARALYAAESIRRKYRRCFDRVPSPLRSVLKGTENLVKKIPGRASMVNIDANSIDHLVQYYREDIRAIADKYSIDFGWMKKYC